MTSRPIATITVDLGDRGYPVLVGHGARSELGAVIPDGVKRVAVLTQAGIPWSVDPGIDSIRIEIPDGEAAKSLAVRSGNRLPVINIVDI